MAMSIVTAAAVSQITTQKAGGIMMHWQSSRIGGFTRANPMITH